MAEIKSSVRHLVRESQNILTTSRNPNELCNALEKISALLPKQNVTDANIPTMQQSEAVEEFGRCHYVRFLEYLVGQFSLDWCGRFTNDERRRLVDVFFLDGIHHHSLLALCSAITQSSPSLKRNKCLALLEDFILCGKMSELVWIQCCVLSDLTTSESESAKHRIRWEQLLTVIVTLPDRIANKLHDKCSTNFLPKQYFTTLAKDLLVVLHKAYNQLKATKDCSLMFVSQLMGRICLHGHADTVFSFLLPHFVKLTANDFIWCRVCSRIIVRTPEGCLESIMECLVKKIPWYGIMSRLLGDALLSNKKLLFLLTNKFLLLRCYDQELVPQNIIGYLADSPNRRSLIAKTLKMLLDVWGDSSAVKHTSYNQHVYITKCILICLSHLKQQEKMQLKSVLMQKLLSGMQCHLSSPIHKVRRLGMITAEALTKMLETDGPKLTFEYEDDEETRMLWSLLVPPEDPGVEWITNDVVEMSLEKDDSMKGISSTSQVEEDVTSLHGQDDLDSDDDLEPYDMSEDVKLSQVKTPMYIRDCIEGLIAKENRELTETSLRVAEKLVNSKPDNIEEVCVEFVQSLLHLEDIYEIDSFTSLRHSAMVAATVQCPILVSRYLITEFYDRNYNIRQRLDMLQVLAAAAQELSQPLEETVPSSGLITCTRHRPLTQAAPNPSEDVEHWRDIIQRRIETKTRRFAKGRSTAAPSPVASRFAPVAGHFFFPLVKCYDSKMNTMDMMGDDFLLLGRMLYTLGIIVHAAQHSPICRQMAVGLLELVWVLRYHTEVFVRQALMFAVSMVILSVPSHLLVSDLQDEMLECKLWLEDIVGKDPNVECRGLAAQTLVVMGSVVQKELGADTR